MKILDRLAKWLQATEEKAEATRKERALRAGHMGKKIIDTLEPMFPQDAWERDTQKKEIRNGFRFM